MLSSRRRPTRRRTAISMRPARCAREPGGFTSGLGGTRFTGSSPAAAGGSVEKARRHFKRAVELSGGLRASPFLALAESVSVRNQDRAEFEALLQRALAIDPEAKPEWRLVNIIMQRRARWLLAR